MEKIIYSQSFIDFMKKSDCKVANILYRLNKKHYTSLIATSAEVNYLTFRGDGTISFLPKGKKCIYTDSGTWAKENRQNGKPSKVIKKLLSEKVTKYFKDSDFECFTNAYKAEFNEGGYKFALLPHNEIPDVYCMGRKTGEGSLNNSCMNDDSSYLDIYKYCKQLSILTLINKDEELCGRALVWKISDDITLMDRVYVTDDFMYEKFLSYCTMQNWWRKKDYKSYDNKQAFVDSDGNIVDKNFTIVTGTSHDGYPYIDTFQYGEDGSINNYRCGDYTYNNTDGTRDGEEDEEEDHEDEIYIENGQSRYRGEWYHIDDCVCVGDDWYHEDDDNICLVNDTYYNIDDSDIIKIDGDYYLIEDCTFCERDDCYYKQDDCVYCEDDEEDVLRDEALEIEDKWYHKESDLIFEHNGKYYLVESGVEA